MIAWYVMKISVSLVRLRVFLDARDIEHRKARVDESKARAARSHVIDTWLRDTRAIGGKLFSSTERSRAIGEELVAQDRMTVEMSLVPQCVEAPPGEPLSWEELKREGLIGSTAHAGIAESPIRQPPMSSDGRQEAKV